MLDELPGKKKGHVDQYAAAAHAAAAAAAKAEEAAAAAEEETQEEEEATPEFSSLDWKKDGKTINQIIVGEEVKLFCKVKNIDNGENIKFNVFEKDTDKEVAKDINGRVNNNGEASATWKVAFEKYDKHTYGDDELGTSKPAPRWEIPDYYFTASYDNADDKKSEAVKVAISRFRIDAGWLAEKYDKDKMRDFWAKGKDGNLVPNDKISTTDPNVNINTSCSGFLPTLLAALGGNVKADIAPNGGNAASLLTLFSNPANKKLTEIADNRSAPTEAEAKVRANAAQALANAGYLVIGIISSHVAVVGPRDLNYGAYPDKAWAGHGAPSFSEGNGFGGYGVLRQYPVFVQAGAYTGIVNPGNAMTRSDFNSNRGRYFLYTPLE